MSFNYFFYGKLEKPRRLSTLQTIKTTFSSTNRIASTAGHKLLGYRVLRLTTRIASEKIKYIVERKCCKLLYPIFQNANYFCFMKIAFSSVFIFFEAFRLTLVKKNRQNEESRENVALYRK